MDMSCGILSLVGVVLVSQWFLILFYCRFKFKTRYSLATLVTFLTMFLYLHLAFSCFNWYGGKDTHHLHDRDYDPRIRSINTDNKVYPIRDVRELLHNNKDDDEEWDLNNNDVNPNPKFSNNVFQSNQQYSKSMGNNEDQPTQFDFDGVNDGFNVGQLLDNQKQKNFHQQNEFFQADPAGEETFNGHPNGVDRGALATNRRKEEHHPQTNAQDGEAQWQDQWNENIPSVQGALNGLQKNMQQYKVPQAPSYGSETVSTAVAIERNLKHNIYNDVKQTMVTMTEYREMVDLITSETRRQIKQVNSIPPRQSLGAWASVKDNLPIPSKVALEKFRRFLTWWEQIEITYYQDIYFLGLGVKKLDMVNNLTVNYGFDHEPNKHDNGEYIATVGDHVAYRYEIIKYLGSGSYGVVVRAYDHKTKQLVAIKFMVNEEDWWDGSIHREMNMMLKIENDAPRNNYFPRILDHFMFRNHKCVVMELLGTSMYRHNRNDEPIRNMTLLRRYASDILNAMADLQSMGVIHGDLKPDNIMYLYGKNNDSDGQLLKVADFGLGCIKGSEIFVCKKNHLQTRYYRCPEVMFSLPYETSCDMFSVGIILAEFYLGKPPFWGETNTDQVAAMMEVLGLVPPHMIEESPWQHVYRNAICYVTENGFKRKPYRKPLEKVLQGMPGDLYHLITRCLTYEPEERITAYEALNHPFILNNV